MAGQCVNHYHTSIFNDFDDVYNFNIMNVVRFANSYILEVDLENLQHLHDLPLIPIYCDSLSQLTAMYSSAFVSQRYIIYYNSRNLHGFAII